MKKIFIRSIIFIAAALCACNKNNSPALPNHPLEVYVSGSIKHGAGYEAVYWKNDSMIILPDDDLGSRASGIVVNGGDVYVSGQKGYKIGYWKNNVFMPLADTSGDPIVGLAVIGADVYAAGYVPGNTVFTAEYWKNGQITDLTGDSVSATANSIAVSGTNVIVGGTERKGLSPTIAKYWINGKGVNLTDGSRFAFVNSVAISGNDIYAAGGETDRSYQHMIAKYWKNGVPYALSDSSGVDMANSIVVVGNDVLVAGYAAGGNLLGTVGTHIATYWKNHEPVVRITDSKSDSRATSIAVAGSNVYIAYQQNYSGFNSQAKYWVNGQTVYLTDGSVSSFAFSIFIPLFI